MKNGSMLRPVAMVAMAALVVGCGVGEAPTSALVPDASFGFLSTPPTGTTERLAEVERVEVCKDYVMTSGAQAPTASFTANGNVFTLDDGECREIWLIGGSGEDVTVTETAPATGFGTTIKVTNVAGQVTNVNGVSTTVHPAGTAGFLLEFINTELDGCTLTQGYWKNHGEDWDDAGDNKPFLTTDLFYNSGLTYLTIMNTPPKGNAYFQLAHQFIAASLNVNGLVSSTPGVTAALQGADAFFEAAAAGTPAPTGATRTQVLAWATTLALFNEGGIGPGHCDD